MLFIFRLEELINTEGDEQEEKEVLLLPGTFLLCGREKGLLLYTYNQSFSLV